GRTYLEIAGLTGSQSLAFVFGDDDATAIDNVNADDNDNLNVNANLNNAYNLSGQRVNSSYKGIVIVGGRKIMLND
ncbi:MAG: hypothetical protein J5914_05295, partial [Prevotella sp.]|nr:hypothetical protein [Prevotella sp.]